MKRSDINFRDPYVVLHEGMYYLYGSSGYTGRSFSMFKCDSLDGDWEGPFMVCNEEIMGFTSANFWAPEVHQYRGNFYLFGTFLQPGTNLHGTYIMKSESGTPEGPFLPHSRGPITPTEWCCLDGTLYVSPEGKPYMVFCHEWTQIQKGTICAVALSEDLSEAAGEPFLIIRAEDSFWTHPRENMMVTDGPFMHRSANGDLLMIWSSFDAAGYLTVVCRSDNGDITGNWSYLPYILCKDDSGHGMIFRDKEGRLLLSLHSPNKSPLERPIFHPLTEDNEKGLVKL